MAHQRVARSTTTFLLALLLLGGIQGCGEDKGNQWLGPDADGDGWPRDLDCDDQDDSVFPGADEILDDEIDQDCSGSAAVTITMGGAPSTPQVPSSAGSGSGGGGGATGGIDGGETGGLGGQPDSGGGSGTRGDDVDGDGFAAVPNGKDCDDERLEIHPAALEIPLNGIDEDCDGSDLVGRSSLLFPLSGESRPFEAPVIAKVQLEGKNRLLMAWSDSRRAPGQDIYGQILDSQGRTVGDELSLETDDNAQKTDLALVSNGESFLLTWVTANGLHARVLGPDGIPQSIVYGYGPAGSVRPSPAYSGEHWAVAWLDGVSGEAFVRAMTTDGVRGDVLSLGEGDISGVHLVGVSEGFVAAWAGRLDEERFGIVAQARSLTAYPAAEPREILQGQTNDPVLAHSEGETVIAFSLGGAFRYTATLSLDSELRPTQSEPLRLSSETPAVYETRIASAGSSFFVTWNDARYTSHAPPAQAVYLNEFSADSPKVHKASGIPLIVDEVVQNGGVVAQEDRLFFSVLFGDRAGLLIRR